MKKIILPLLLFVLFTLFALLVLSVSCDYMNEQQYKVKVHDKERVVTTESSYYLIFTDNGEFRISDQLFIGKFNSSTMYGQIRRDSTYVFTTRGYRVPFLSMYPNVTHISK